MLEALPSSTRSRHTSWGASPGSDFGWSHLLTMLYGRRPFSLYSVRAQPNRSRYSPVRAGTTYHFRDNRKLSGVPSFFLRSRGRSYNRSLRYLALTIFDRTTASLPFGQLAVRPSALAPLAAARGFFVTPLDLEPRARG